MILPLLPFLLINAPDMSPTVSPPIVFRIPDPETNQTLGRLEICSDTIKHVDLGRPDRWGRPRVNVALNEIGARQLADLSSRYVDYQAELVLDGNVIESPRIM